VARNRGGCSAGPRLVRSRWICGQSREAPEVSCEPELVENCLVVLARVRLPVGRESIVPPGVGEFVQLRDRERCSRLARSKPPLDVLFRPEEVHRASGEDDVVPPVRSRNQAMEQQAFVVDPLVAEFQGNGFTTFGAGCLDLPIYV
jgi:hypothetical protein